MMCYFQSSDFSILYLPLHPNTKEKPYYSSIGMHLFQFLILTGIDLKLTELAGIAIVTHLNNTSVGQRNSKILRTDYRFGFLDLANL